MALRISGGDWSPWADVAHQLVSENQGQQALDIRRDQLRAQREAHQAELYMRQLGLDERARQFDASQGFREEELARRLARDAVLAEQHAQDVKFKMEQSKLARGFKEKEEAIKFGIVTDPKTGNARSITPDDPMYEAHKEYTKNRRKTVNENVELNRRIRFIDGKIRSGEKQIGDLMLTRSQIRGTRPEAVKERQKIDNQIQKIRDQIAKDRDIYNALSAKFFKGYGGAPTEIEAMGEAEGNVPGFFTGLQEWMVTGGQMASPRRSIAPQGAGQMTVEQMTEPLPGSPSSVVEGKFTQKTLDAMARPDTVIGGQGYFVAAKHKDRVKRDLIKLFMQMQEAQRTKNYKKLGELNKLRKEYFKKNRKYLTLNPDRS